MPPAHSRTYRSASPVRLARSPLLAGPFTARFLNSPVRSPSAASTIVAAAALSARTRPVNSAARFSSIVFLLAVAAALPAAGSDTGKAFIGDERAVQRPGNQGRSPA